jgi:uncharacterized SAM-binding protein YcdF (DUF218 family)
MTSAGENRLFVFGRIAQTAAFRTLYVCALFLATLTAGFFVFAHRVSVMPAGSLRAADGIVVLTGDEDRISEAIQLLAKGRAGRLLISGVNKATRAPQIIGLNKASRDEAFLFNCCVDLDKRSLNTEENAFETTAWARSRGYRSLIVVTSTYHMPRALIELRQTMPDAELVPYPVKSARLATDWWNDPGTTWVLCKEYLKFVTASARYAANMLAKGPGQTGDPVRTIHARMD